MNRRHWHIVRLVNAQSDDNSKVQDRLSTAEQDARLLQANECAAMSKEHDSSS